MSGQDLIKGFKAYPVASIAGVVSILLILVVYVRGMGQDALRERYEEANHRWNQIESNVFKNSVNLETHLEMAKMTSQDVEERLIRPSELAKNYQYFYRLEGLTGVRITALQQQPASARQPAEAPRGGNRTAATQAPLFTKVGYQMTMTGSYHQTVDFLHAIERGPHFYQLRDFTLQRATDGTRDIVITMNFDLLGRP